MIPKSLKKCELKLISPCFCAGATPKKPELRAASFRGELRWWFRCLGGTRDQENVVFGNAQDNNVRASAVALLLTTGKRTGSPIRIEYDAPEGGSFITYLLMKRLEKGNTTTYLHPEQKFTIELRQRRDIDNDTGKLLELAWDCLCNLGSIGYRKTRTFGAYVPVNPEERKARELINDPRVTKHFRFILNENLPFPNFITLLNNCGDMLKDYRDRQKHGSCPTVLGYAKGSQRQASVVRFRPLIIEDKMFLCIMRAPDITLSSKKNLVELPDFIR